MATPISMLVARLFPSRGGRGTRSGVGPVIPGPRAPMGVLPAAGSRRDAAAGEAEVPLPVEEFDERVELVVRTPERARDQLLAKALCEKHGWAIRPAVADEEDPDCPRGLASHIVEVRLRGSRRGAEGGARQLLLETVGRHVSVTIVGGVLVGAPKSEPMVTWRVFRKSDWRHRRGLGWLASLRDQSGLADVQRTMGVPRPVEEAEVREPLGIWSWLRQNAEQVKDATRGPRALAESATRVV